MRTTWGTVIVGLAVAAAAGVSTTARAQGKISVEQHEGYMKALSTANAALGKKVMSNELAGAAADAQQMATILGDIEKFWAENKKDDAVKWAQEARQTATGLAGALTAGDAAKVGELRKTIGGSCTSCHTAYREGSPKEGGYRLKAGVVQ